MPRKSKPAKRVKNLSRAASALGVTVQLLRAAKNAGCLGFKKSNIDVETVRTFLKTFQPPVETVGGMGDQKLRKLRAEADTKELLVSIKKGLYLVKAVVENTCARVLGSVRALFVQKLEREYPAAVAGLSVVEARIKGKALFDDICTELRKLEQPWVT